MSMEDIFIEWNKYFKKHDEIKTAVLNINDTKEANVIKMTFVWKKDKYWFKTWV